MPDIAEPDWLPPLIRRKNYSAWNAFYEAVYQLFRADFVSSKPSFKGRRLALKRHPLTADGKEATFRHMITEGEVEEDRQPDIRRMERIRWPASVINHSEDTSIKVWRNQRRRNETRILLWLESHEYLVILADRRDYILPWTAYCVDREHTKRKLQREYVRYWQGQEI
ncbi:hypothetical protein [Endozoicomonas sp. 4G]|uniref:hypothetical protein n=1 Tax=Endozoicomonas sp. 4G TaxID=2872754 RepID=UPI002078695D|nr:hypothetical protein [Endozoicomonas sp. 4G]